MPEDATAPTTQDHLGEPGWTLAFTAAAPSVGISDAAPEAAREESPSTRSPEEAIDEVDGLLDAVEEALAALDDGSYGTCHACGSTIEPSRLAADPLVRMCGSCGSGTAVGSG
jgi:RNA polymerase-binding transcription factor DksA